MVDTYPFPSLPLLFSFSLSLSLSLSLSRPISLLVLVVPAISGQSKTRTATLRSLPTYDVVVGRDYFGPVSAVYSRIPARCRHCYSLLPLLPLQSLCSRYYAPTRPSPPVSLSTPPISQTRDNYVNLYLCIVFFVRLRDGAKREGACLAFPVFLTFNWRLLIAGLFVARDIVI